MDKKKAQVQTAKKSRLRKEVKKKDKAGCLWTTEVYQFFSYPLSAV
jgi:hypothetical protein